MAILFIDLCCARCRGSRQAGHAATGILTGSSSQLSWESQARAPRRRTFPLRITGQWAAITDKIDHASSIMAMVPADTVYHMMTRRSP